MNIELSEEQVKEASQRYKAADGDPINFRRLRQLGANAFAFDAVDACFFTGDRAGEQEARPVVENMVARWVRRLIEETVFNPQVLSGAEEIKAEQRSNALYMIALIVDKCQELGIKL